MNFIKRTILGFLAMLMFGTSVCFAVDVHSCDDIVQSKAYFSTAKPCENMKVQVEEDVPECCKKTKAASDNTLKTKATISKKKCCHNESYNFKADLNKNSQTAQAIIIPLAKISLVYTELEFNNFNFKEEQLHFIKPPDPEIIQNYQSLHQVFII